MILDEPDQSFLVSKVSAEMKPHALGGLVFQTVIESLVVAVVKALLLQLPLQVPVGLGDEQEIRMLRS